MEIGNFNTTELEQAPMNDCGETFIDDPDDHRENKYTSTVIGHELYDAYGFSCAEIITGEGRETDEQMASRMIFALKTLPDLSKIISFVQSELGLAETDDPHVKAAYDRVMGWGV